MGSTGSQSPAQAVQHQQQQAAAAAAAAAAAQQQQVTAASQQPQEVQQRLIIQEGMIHPGFHPVIHQPRSAAFPGLPPPTFATQVQHAAGNDQKPSINHLLQKLS